MGSSSRSATSRRTSRARRPRARRCSPVWTRAPAAASTAPRIWRATGGCSARPACERAHRQVPLRRRPLHRQRAVPEGDLLPLHDVQADLRRRRDRERQGAERVDRGHVGRRARDALPAGGGQREELLLRLRREPVRRRVAGVGGMQRAGDDDRRRRRPAVGAHLHSLRGCVGDASGGRSAATRDAEPVKRAYLLDLGVTPYLEAWDLQRSIAAAVGDGTLPDTVVMLEHPPVVTLGRRTDEGELHLPDGADVEIVETDRGGKSTFHAPGQLVCYPILDLTRHGQDVKKYCRDLEEALIQTLGAVGVEATRIDGLTGIWLERPPRKIASIGVHISRWVTTHGYALNVALDPAPFTEWITACGLEDAAFTTIGRELGRSVSVDEVRPHATAALESVFGLTFSDAPADLRVESVRQRVAAAG